MFQRGVAVRAPERDIFDIPIHEFALQIEPNDRGRGSGAYPNLCRGTGKEVVYEGVEVARIDIQVIQLEVTGLAYDVPVAVRVDLVERVNDQRGTLVISAPAVYTHVCQAVPEGAGVVTFEETGGFVEASTPSFTLRLQVTGLDLGEVRGYKAYLQAIEIRGEVFLREPEVQINPISDSRPVLLATTA